MKKSKSKDGSGGDNEQDDSGEEDHTEVRSDVSDMESHRSTQLHNFILFTLFMVKSHRILGGQIKLGVENFGIV